MDVILISICIGCFIGGFGLFWLISRNDLIKDIKDKKEKSEKMILIAKNKSIQIAKEAERKIKQFKSSQIKKIRDEIESAKRLMTEKETNLLEKEKNLNISQTEVTKGGAQLELKERICNELELKYKSKEQELNSILEDAKSKIEIMSGLTREEAKLELVNMVENEAKILAARKIKEIENNLKDEAEVKAKNIIALAIQKYAASYTSEKTSSVVTLPSDDMKGRIIGREGRNIRTIELKTGVDVIIDDTPGIVTVSSHNPIRREIASRSIKKLLDDGRVHPGRIEEIVDEIEEQLGKEIQQLGEDAILEIGISNMNPELIKLVGNMKYRTSYSQNILDHSLEVAQICGVLASEIGLDPKLAKRAGLLHDIGKSVDHKIEGNHVDI